METTYHIFEVFDCKGGELGSDTNLSKSQFIRELADLYKDACDDLTKDASLEDCIKVVKDTELQIDLYPGDDTDFCGEIYQSINNRLREVQIGDFYKEIGEFIFENWR